MRIIIKGIQNLYITKTYNNKPESFKSIIIYINSTSNVLFEVKKLHYPIFWIYTSHNIEYFQLCQGQDTLNELYFYLSTRLGNNLFTEVFGTFDSFYMKEKEIKKISDLNFDNINETNFYQAYNKDRYLKIKCNSSLMLRHVDIGSFHQSKLKANQRYYINNEYININKYTFDEIIIGNNLQLKFIIYGLKNNETIDLIYDEEIYQLNNTPFELNFTYKENKNDLFYFKVGKGIEVIAA